MKKLNLEKIREDAKKLCAKFIENVDQQLVELMNGTISKVEDQMNLPSPINGQETATINNKNRHKDADELPSKVFLRRDSLLTELFQISHIQTIYNIFVAVLMLLFLNTILYDFVDSGKINLDFEMMKFAFGKVQTVLTVWLIMKLSLLALLFPVYHYWAHNRLHFLGNKQKGLVDYIFLTLYIVYLCGLLILPLHTVIHEKMPPASTFILLSEQVRLLMKVHAFVRENIPRALNYRPFQDGEKTKETPCPDFGKFLYFLFAPTLVYRDNYPRTPCVRWRYVTGNFLQVLACLFYIYYIFQRFLTPVFHRVGHERFTPKALLLMVFGSMMPATLVLLITFFAILHAWMNAFAEMLRFGDRMFYKDWWNSTSFATYYRTWNVVVHDWLYTYIYKDMYWLTGRNKMGPLFMVFLLSAVVHEYIITFAFGFFYPVLLVLFGGCGVIFFYITDKRKARSWNVFMWTSMFIGTGLMMSLYSMEWYARENCIPNENPMVDYLLPRSWTCNSTFNQQNR